MRILLGDKFFDAFIKLPKQIQSKVMDFQKKFSENSKSASINLEKISTFKDNNLRTARIDQKYRAIIGVTPGFNDFYLLWIDNHDEAMDWAKNKLFELNENTSVAQLFTVPEVEDILQEDSVQNPRSSKWSLEDLLELGVPKELIPIVHNLKSLDDLEKVEKYLPEDAFENLFNLFDGADINLLKADLKQEMEVEGLESALSKRFYTILDDELMESLLNGDFEKWQVFLHPSQRKIVDSDYSGSFKVTGGAGTGKTVAALHRTKRLTSAIKIDQKVLFCTFTNALKRNLEDLICKFKIQSSKVELNTVDSAGWELGNQFNLINKNTVVLGVRGSKTSIDIIDEILESNLSVYDSEFLAKEFNDVIHYYNIQTKFEYFKQLRAGRGKALGRRERNDIWKLYEIYQTKLNNENYIDRYSLFNRVSNHLFGAQKKPFRHVIVDEVQDLSIVELRFLRSLVNEIENDIFLVGDPFQSIYGNRVNFKKAGINIVGRKSVKLKINYRTSEEIRKAATDVIEDEQYSDWSDGFETLDGYRSLFHGSKPTYELFNTVQEEVLYVIGKIREIGENNFDLKSIAIATRLRDDFKSVKSALHDNNFPYYDLTSKSGDINGVRICTFHSLKGLEFPFVFLCSVNKRTMPFKPTHFENWEESAQKEHIKAEKSLLYVAMTRAVKEVYLTGVGANTDLFKP